MSNASGGPRILSSILALTAMLVLAAGSAAAAKPPTKVPASCGRPLLERPAALVLACGDAGLQADHLEWKTWGGQRSVARGRIIEKVCRPDCASGRIRRHPGEVILSGRVRCGGYYSYSRAKARWGGRTRWNEPWIGCPA